MFAWHMTAKELPEKAGFYLVASEIEPGYYSITEGEFFKAGDKAWIEPAPMKPQPDVTKDEMLTNLFKFVTNTKVVPHDGFYETQEVLYEVHPLYWAELPPLPHGLKNQNDYMAAPEPLEDGMAAVVMDGGGP